jgi:hypothetical protein
VLYVRRLSIQFVQESTVEITDIETSDDGLMELAALAGEERTIRVSLEFKFVLSLGETLYCFTAVKHTRM